MSRTQTQLVLAFLFLCQGGGASADSQNLFGQSATLPQKNPAPPAATAPASAPAPATGATTGSTPSATQSPKATSTDSAPRGPSSVDQGNTYRPAGGSFSSQGSPAAKEPVIDGKAIPKVIDFSGAGAPGGAEPSAPQAQQPGPKGNRSLKPKVSRKRVDTSIDFQQENDGL